MIKTQLFYYIELRDLHYLMVKYKKRNYFFMSFHLSSLLVRKIFDLLISFGHSAITSIIATKVFQQNLAFMLAFLKTSNFFFNSFDRFRCGRYCLVMLEDTRNDCSVSQIELCGSFCIVFIYQRT